ARWRNCGLWMGITEVRTGIHLTLLRRTHIIVMIQATSSGDGIRPFSSYRAAETTESPRARHLRRFRLLSYGGSKANCSSSPKKITGYSPHKTESPGSANSLNGSARL